MKSRKNKWLIVLIAIMLISCLTAAVLTACEVTNDDPPAPPIEEGPEKGVYIYEDITLTLSGTGAFTLDQNGNLSSGAYATAENGEITLTFIKGQGTATCKNQDDILELSLNSSVYRLYKQVKYTVTFDNGQSTSEVSVVNGALVRKPADPAKDGYKFVGWYKTSDFSGKPFDFGTEVVTANTTLYAKWVQYTEGAKEYNVSFNLGYDATEQIASQTTINGKLYLEVPAPERKGYTFKGWWTSVYEQADKLTSQYVEGNTFTSDTTLFALWQQNGTTLVTLDVNGSGASWTGLTGSAKLTITNPDKTTAEYTIGATGSSAYDYDLSAKPAGEYKYTLTYGEDITVERYYLNKALDRVSGFEVVGDSVLLFDGVDNADGYYVTVTCGDSRHNHKSVYIGKSTNYVFNNCPMTKGGIVFEVKAVSANYYSSVATFVFDRALAAVDNIAYDPTTGLLSWGVVDNAQHYIVTIGEEEYYLGTETKLDIKHLPAGKLNVTVKAVTDGYNSAAATTVVIDKTNVAAPANIALSQGVLTWTAVEGATSYKVQVGTQVLTSDTNQLTLEGNYIVLGRQYEVKVKAVFEDESESLWSNAYTIDSSKSSVPVSGLTYTDGLLSWTARTDAASYEYKVNDGAVTSTSATYATVTLNQAGINKLQVRYLGFTDEYSEWATLEVYAYTLTFDSTGGSGVDKQFKAIGDSVVTQTETTRTGYTFAGWYNVAGGASANGAEFTAKTYNNPFDTVLYANWTPCQYELKFDYNEHGEGNVTTANVTYTGDYTLPIPSIKSNSSEKAFVGWYATADGKGVQFTDAQGNSIKPWNITDGATLYAKYVDAFSFAPDGKNGYSVKASKNLSWYTKTITIPAMHNDQPVRSISEYGFSKITHLETVTLPATLESIPTTAFEGCKRIKAFYMSEPTDKDKQYVSDTYTVVDGTVLSTMYGETTLFLVPPAKTTGTYYVPYGVTVIGSRTFLKDNKLQFSTIVIPSTVKTIEPDAFVGCSSLKNVIFETAEQSFARKPDKKDGETAPAEIALTIADNAFSDTQYVESLILPARLVAMDNIQQFLSQFKLLSSVKIVGSFEDAAYASLSENDGGKNIAGMLANADKNEIIYCPIGINNGVMQFEVEIPSSILSIADHAFDSFDTSKDPALRKYNPVTKITFLGGINIGDYAFYKSRNLNEVVFGATTDQASFTIGKYAFYDSNLAALTFEENGSWTTTGEEDRFVATSSCNVTEIGDYAFAATNVAEVKLPNSLVSLGAHAFDGASVATIDLSDVSVELEFGDYAFANCRALVTCELTKNVGTMNFNLVFYNCKKYKPQVSADNPNYKRDDQGVLYNKDFTEILFYPDSYQGQYIIPDTVTKIGGAVFKGKDSLQNIVISAAVVEIGDSAFEDCANLVAVTFAPDGDADLTIGAKAFFNCSSLASIELPARTVSIGEQCFAAANSGKSSLVTAKLNEGLTTIGANAFMRTDKLSAVYIPSTVTSIGYQAFYNSGIKTVTFGENGEDGLVFERGVFYGCANLAKVVLPERLTNIPQDTFYNNFALTSVTVPTTVANIDSATRAIGKNAFYGCARLSEIVFTKGGDLPLSFAGGAFYGCDSLVKLSLPNRVASVNTGTYDLFEYGSNIGKNSTGDFNMVNSNVPAWTNRYMSGSTDVSNLAEIEVENGGEFASFQGVLYNGDKSVLVWCPFGKKGEVVVAKETEKFRASAFNNCHYITSVVFEEGGEADFVMEDATDRLSDLYGTNVFFGCFRLETITFPERLTYLGNNALYSSSGLIENIDGKHVSTRGNGLTKVLFEDNCKLTAIGENAFKNVTITEIELPEGVKTIGKNVFLDSTITKITFSKVIDSASFTNVTASAPGLQTIIIPDDSETLSSSDNGQVIYSVGQEDLLYVVNDFQSDNYIVPSTVKNIAEKVFQNRVGVKKVTFESSETVVELTIGDYAFSGTGITSIQLPKRIKSFGKGVFQNCLSLSDVTFESGYSYADIPDYTFKGCISLDSIVIPGEVLSIGWGAFMGAGVDDENGVSGLKTIEFALCTDGRLGKIETIGADAFNECYALTTIKYALKKDADGNVVYADGNTLPYTLTTIGKSPSGSSFYFSGPFYKCTSLKSIVLPDELTAITGNSSNKGMFEGCTNLASVKLPSQLTEIKQNAFKDTGITTLDLSGYDDGSLTIYEGVFSGATNLRTLDLSKVGTLYLQYTFDNCTSLESLEFSDSIQLKGNEKKPTSNYYGFNGAAIKSVTINQNVLKEMFRNCQGLVKVVLGEKVQAIQDSAFVGCTSLTTVDMPKSEDYTVTVGSKSFQNASSLKVFDLSKATAIGANAFENCSSLTSGSLNSSITELKNNTFAGTGLTSIDLSNIKTLGSNVFQGSKLKEITLPATITKMGTSVFADCTELTTANVNAKLTTKKLPDKTFMGCVNLTKVTIGDSVTEIGTSTFAGTALTEINLNNVAKIGNEAFANISSLKTINVNKVLTLGGYGNTFIGSYGANFVVPEGSELYADGGLLYVGKMLLVNIDKRPNVIVKPETTSIAPNAFRYNTYVESVSLPTSLTTIEGYCTFADCTNLKSINLENVTNYKTTTIKSTTQDTFKNTAITELTVVSTDSKVFSNMPNLVNVTFVGENFNIAANAFLNDTALSTINVSEGSSIASVGNSAFSGCSSLSSFDVFQGITSLGTKAFEKTGLVSVVIPEAITSVPDGAFQNCNNLVSVTIHSGVTNFATSSTGGSFYKDFKLVEVINLGSLPIEVGSTEYGHVAQYALNVITDNETAVDVDDDGYIFYYDGIEHYLVGYIGTETALRLPVGRLGNNYQVYNYAFYNNTRITSVVGNSTVTSIGDNAFEGCTALTSVTGFDKISFIGDSAFKKCALTEITLPADIQGIGDYAFNGCNDIIATEQGNALYIGNKDNLYTVLYKAVDKTLESCTVNANTKYIASEAFSGCNALTSITIPEGVKTIGAKAFYNCSALTEIVIPDSVTYIGAEAFSGCSALASATLGNGLKAIAYKQFYNCASLTEITIPSDVTAIGTEAFSGCTALQSVAMLGKVTEIPSKAFYGCAALTTVTLQEGLTAIGEYAFQNCKVLTGLSNLDKVSAIGNNAFSGCSELVTIDSLTNVKTIDTNAFNNCAKLTSVGTLTKVESIGVYAFQGCQSIKSLIIANNVTFIGRTAFSGWTAAQSITFTVNTGKGASWPSTWNSSCKAAITFAAPSDTTEE